MKVKIINEGNIIFSDKDGINILRISEELEQKDIIRSNICYFWILFDYLIIRDKKFFEIFDLKNLQQINKFESLEREYEENDGVKNILTYKDKLIFISSNYVYEVESLLSSSIKKTDITKTEVNKYLYNSLEKDKISMFSFKQIFDYCYRS